MRSCEYCAAHIIGDGSRRIERCGAELPADILVGDNCSTRNSVPLASQVYFVSMRGLFGSRGSLHRTNAPVDDERRPLSGAVCTSVPGCGHNAPSHAAKLREVKPPLLFARRASTSLPAGHQQLTGAGDRVANHSGGFYVVCVP